MNKDEVKKIALLARVQMNDSQLEKMAKEIDSILHYVDQIKNAALEMDESGIENASTRNVMRSDEENHEGGEFSERLIQSALENKDGYIKVKKISGKNDVN